MPFFFLPWWGMKIRVNIIIFFFPPKLVGLLKLKTFSTPTKDVVVVVVAAADHIKTFLPSRVKVSSMTRDTFVVNGRSGWYMHWIPKVFQGHSVLVEEGLAVFTLSSQKQQYDQQVMQEWNTVDLCLFKLVDWAFPRRKSAAVAAAGTTVWAMTVKFMYFLQTLFIFRKTCSRDFLRNMWMYGRVSSFFGFCWKVNDMHDWEHSPALLFGA